MSDDYFETVRMPREIPVIVDDVHQLYVEVAGANGDGAPQCHVSTTPLGVRFAEDTWVDGKRVKAVTERFITIRGREYLFEVTFQWCSKYPDPPEVFRWHLDYQAYRKYRHGTSAATSKAQHVLDKLALKAVEILHEEMPDLLDWCYYFDAQSAVRHHKDEIRALVKEVGERQEQVRNFSQIPKPPANDLFPFSKEAE